MVNALVAAGFTPLLAMTVKAKVPSFWGVPLRTPFGVRVRPSGRLPEAMLQVMVGSPVADRVWLYD